MNVDKWQDFTYNISKRTAKNKEAFERISNNIQLNKAWQELSSTIIQTAKEHILYTFKTS